MAGVDSSMGTEFTGLKKYFYDSLVPAILREPFPVVPGTPEGDEVFKEMALKHHPSEGISSAMPEARNALFLRAVERGGGFATRSQQLLANNGLTYAMMSCALYAWNPTDEQVVASFALVEATWSWECYLGEAITPAHLAVAALAPGAEDSTLVRSLASSLLSLTTLELRAWKWQVEDRILGFMNLEAQRSGLSEAVMRVMRRRGRVEPLMALNDANWLRRKYLHYTGMQYLNQVIASGVYEGNIFQVLEGGGAARKEDVLGAEKLLSLFPEAFSHDGSSMDCLLPLEFLLALPSFRTERLGKFHALVEEYNVEWALASMDWSGGGEGEH